MTTLTNAGRASMRRTTDQLAIRSASLRNLAVNDKEHAGTLHDAADLLYDASQELGFLRNSHERLVGALHDELEALGVWMRAAGIPDDVFDGMQISRDKIKTALTTAQSKP